MYTVRNQCGFGLFYSFASEEPAAGVPFGFFGNPAKITNAPAPASKRTAAPMARYCRVFPFDEEEIADIGSSVASLSKPEAVFVLLRVMPRESSSRGLVDGVL